MDKAIQHPSLQDSVVEVARVGSLAKFETGPSLSSSSRKDALARQVGGNYD